MIRRRSTSSLVSPLPKRAPTPRCCDRLAARPAQARQPVAQQRQLDLGLALERVRVLGEDVEDHRRAVDRRAAQQLLEVELLCRRQFVVEHDRVGVDGDADLLELLGFALADVPRVVSLSRPCTTRHDIGAGGVDEQLELVEAGVDRRLVDSGEGDGDEHDLLGRNGRSASRRRFLVGSEGEFIGCGVTRSDHVLDGDLDGADIGGRAGEGDATRSW